jgi:membrane-bound serine protease (ClpP class)
LTDATVLATDAVESDVADFEATFLGEVLVGADGLSAVLSDGEAVRLDLVSEEEAPEGEVTDGPRVQQVPVVVTRFRKLQGIPGFLHKINTPTYAYVLLIIGLAAIVFEFFASSIGIAGGLGALCALASFQGMGALPVNWWAVALIGIGILFMAFDVQLSNLGVLTITGTVLAVVGSLFFTYVSDYRVRWWAVALCLLGLVLFYAIAMTTVVRTRFSTPTIGREALVGATGETASVLNPVGLVTIEGATWKARAHRGRIQSGLPVTVRAIDGLVLEVDAKATSSEEA